MAITACWTRRSGSPQASRRPDGGSARFLQVGCTQNDIYPLDRFIGGGVTWTGLLDSRPGDIIGFGPQYAHISEEAGLEHPYELAIEGFYLCQITPWAFVQPDLQYIVHPGGQYSNALVATVRLQISF